MVLAVLSKHDICFAQMHRLFCLNMMAGALRVIMGQRIVVGQSLQSVCWWIRRRVLLADECQEHPPWMSCMFLPSS